ncbi:MAG: dihydroorotate dehydrogenase electron transfer subunit [Clostridiaceae bacterium]|nr:dihydroorotate dehydrogenase electron transfer subunit [Clostridiaceae bacterium]
MNFTSAKVLSNIEISDGVYRLILMGQFQGKPGQFYMLRAWEEEPILSRPISIENVDDKSITFLYQVVGKGTKILSKLKAKGELNIQGPLGNTFPVEQLSGKVGIITGGIGIAPMELVVKSLKVDSIDFHCGFRNKSYLINEIMEHVTKVYISTETGSEGYKGYVTDLFKPENYDVVLCCGPEVMMNKVIKMCKDKNVTSYVSMEKHMACGVGACLVCTCKTIDGNKRTCKDGPIFLGSEVMIDA